jgi:hypothetical protein
MFKINDLVALSGDKGCYKITEFSSSGNFCKVKTRSEVQLMSWWRVDSLKMATHEQKLWFGGNSHEAM